MADKSAEWASLKGLMRIESERYHKATGKTEREIRYYSQAQLDCPTTALVQYRIRQAA